MITEAILLAGGKGTRMSSIDEQCAECESKRIPKALISINNKTLIQRQLRYLYSQGIQKVVLALGYDWGKIHFKVTRDPSLRQKKNLFFSIEKEPLGTAGAIKLALEHITTDRFLICNVDDLTNIPIQNMEREGDNVVALGNFKCPFGVAQLNGTEITSFREKALLSDVWVSTGFVIVNKKEVESILPTKGSLEHDVYPKLQLNAYQHSGSWLTVNTKKDIIEVDEYFRGIENESNIPLKR